MTVPAPVPYQVVYSERVRREFRILHGSAAARGLGRVVIEAAKVIDARLRVYPQFGDPLQDLATEGETLWFGIVGPLVVYYVIDEARRIVFVVAPFKALRHLGL
jgi:hypothetical protein